MSARFSAAGRRFVIATPHQAATRAGMAAFEAGGNAADAAIAANAMLAVVYPHMCGIGGDFFAIVADGASRTVINGSGAAALAINTDKLRQTHRTMPAFGPLSISVPGTVAGWGEVIGRFGRLSFAQALTSAIDAAEDGTPVAGSLARAIGTHHDRLRASGPLGDLLLPSGAPLEAGRPLRQPALAATLRSLADEGPSALYDGHVARKTVAALRQLGSPLTEDDFARHETEITEPLSRPYRGRTVLVPPPNSQGFVLEEILCAVEQGAIEPDHLGRDALTIGRLFLLASADRDRLSADPRRADVPVERLLGDRHLAELLGQARTPQAPAQRRVASGDTVGIVAAEQDGLWVSINQSVYDAFGSAILEPSTGILFHNRGSAFSLDPDSPNRLEGGKRPAHTLMPVMVLEGEKPVIASATMGRSAHAQIHAELLMAVIDQGRDPFDAIDRPRWLAGGLRANTGLVAESRVPAPIIEAFVRSGIEVERLEAWDEQVGHAQLIAAMPDGDLHAASDPRADGAALAR